MLDDKQIYVVVTVLFLVLGVLGVYVSLDIIINVQNSIERGLILIDYSNPFIKYSPSITGVLGSLGLLILPLIVKYKKLAIGDAYYGGGKYQRARTDLVTIMLFTPSAIMFFTSIYYSNLKINYHSPLFVPFVFLIVFMPIKAIYGFIKYKNEET